MDAGNGNDTDIDGTKGSFAPVILPLQPQEVGTVISPSYSVNSEAQRGPQGVNREPWALSPCPRPPTGGGHTLPSGDTARNLRKEETRSGTHFGKSIRVCGK